MTETILGSPNNISSAWTLIVDEPGNSLSNWTVVGGTWTVDAGEFFKQTDPAPNYRGLRLTAPVYRGPGLIAQADIRFPTSAVLTRRAMLGVSGNGAITGNDPWGGLQENVDAVVVQRGDQEASTQALVVNEDEWYTVRVTPQGNMLDVMVNDVHQWTVLNKPPSGSQQSASFFTLVCLSGEVHYKNIKVWRSNGPV